MTSHATPTTLDSIKKSLVALRMPRALEMLDTTFRKIEQGEIDAIEALDHLLVEEVTIRENRRVKTALRLARLTTIKTIAGFDFTFQPSLDRNRILALAELKFIDRAEVVHLLGPPGTGKSHLATALAVEAVKAGRSVAFSTLADIIASLARAEKEGTLRERMRYLCRAALLVVDEIVMATGLNPAGTWDRSQSCWRQRNNWLTWIPAARATSEATAPGSMAAVTIRSFSDCDQLRRRCTDVITSICVFVIGVVLGLLLGLATFTQLRKAVLTGCLHFNNPGACVRTFPS